MKILRKDTLPNEAVEFRFDTLASRFVVANFTEGNLIAKFGEEDQVGVLIPMKTARVVATRLMPRQEDMVSVVYVTAQVEMENGCEIQELDY